MSFLVWLTFAVLFIASYTDFTTREVPDWLSYSFIASVLGYRLLYAVSYADWTLFFSGFFGFLVFVVLGYFMFYTGQWGGGDSKLLMGMGAVLGFGYTFDSLLVSFFVNLLLLGAIYGLVYSLGLAFLHLKKVSKAFRHLFLKYRMYHSLMLFFLLVSFTFGFFVQDDYLSFLLYAFGLLLFFSFYVWIFSKTVEQACMYKWTSPYELTEGDWVHKEVKYRGKVIAGPKDLGIEKTQIKQLINLYKRKKIKKVLVRDGIPFVPSFLFAYTFLFFYGSIFLFFI